MKNAQGDYILGSPGSVVTPSIYGVPVVLVPTVANNRALVGDLGQTPLLDREQPTLAISYENGTNFERNLATIRVEARAGLAIFDAGAFQRVSLDPRS